jgi:hypothetical protein
VKQTIFLRVAKCKGKRFMFKVDTQKSNKPLLASGYKEVAHPTICIKLNLTIPDEIFEKAQAELDLKIKEAENCSEIKVETKDETH